MVSKIIQYAPMMYKAIVAGIAAAIPAYAAVAQTGVPWWIAALSALGSGVAAGWAVWQVENKPASASAQGSTSPGTLGPEAPF